MKTLALIAAVLVPLVLVFIWAACKAASLSDERRARPPRLSRRNPSSLI